MAQPPSGLSSSLSRHSAGIEQGQQADLDPALMQDMEAVFGGEEATVIAAFEVGRSCKGDMKVVFSDEEATTVIAAFEVGGRDAAFDSSTHPCVAIPSSSFWAVPGSMMLVPLLPSQPHTPPVRCSR